MKNRGARLSRAIRDLRGELELTQAELAELLGVHAMTVSKWERGTSRPTHYQHDVLELLDLAPTLAAAALQDRHAAPALRLARAICAADIGGGGQLALSRRSAQTDSGLAGGLTASEHRVLTLLEEAPGPLTQLQLADALGVSQETVSRVLHRLIASGEVRRLAPRRRATVPGKPPATYARLEPKAVP